MKLISLENIGKESVQNVTICILVIRNMYLTYMKNTHTKRFNKAC
jgi:hypothetical protein